MKPYLKLLLIFFVLTSSAQNIKTIQLRPLQENSFSAIVPLGTTLELSFDDLDADAKNYQYHIQHMTHDWKKSRLLSSQYIDGFQKNTIIDITNSFNTFQPYTHYSVKIPNVNTVITQSGNYLLTVFDGNDEIVFTRRFVLYENAAVAGVAVSRSRNNKTFNTQQTVEFTVNHPNIRVNAPQQEINVVVIKNDNWNETITGLQPSFFRPNQLQYSYTSKNNFWAGNEYLNFDTKMLFNKTINIVKIERKDIFYHYIYPTNYNPNLDYRFNPDINGQFVIRTLEGDDPRTEADYAMMNFALQVEEPFLNKDVYVYGAFNNFELGEVNKMEYDFETGTYFANILLKQGFYNYTFVTADKFNNIYNDVMGSFFQTENEYKVLVYYKPFGGLFDRVIAVGSGTFSSDR